ncbi:MAG: hypothetical protein R3D80_09835 [Paracoccaceae bacterium]
MTGRAYWDPVYGGKAEDALSWFEAAPGLSAEPDRGPCAPLRCRRYRGGRVAAGRPSARRRLRAGHRADLG